MRKTYFQFLFSDLSKRERWGSLLVLLIIATGIVLPRIIEGTRPPVKEEILKATAFSASSDPFVAENDSGGFENFAGTRQRKLHLRYAAVEELMKLGMSQSVATLLKQQYEKGKRLENIEELAKISGLDPEFLKLRISAKSFKNYYLSNRAKLPEEGEEEEPVAKPALTIVRVNHCDTADLMALPGIGAKTARRIVNYRNKLGGFLNFNQLKETFGVDTNTLNELSPYLTIDPAEVKKININTATITQLTAHPYCKNYQAKALVNYRLAHGHLQLKDLPQLKVITSVELQKLLPYLSE